MARLSITLDRETFSQLDKQARRTGTKRATVARGLLRDALVRPDSPEQRQKRANDYRSGRADAREILHEMEGGEMELLP